LAPPTPYLGLRVGMTVSASIPAAVMTVAIFKLIRARGTLLEANLSQTVGSASTSLAIRHDLHHPGALSLGQWRLLIYRSWSSAFSAGRARPVGHDSTQANADRRRQE